MFLFYLFLPLLSLSLNLRPSSRLFQPKSRLTSLSTLRLTKKNKTKQKLKFMSRLLPVGVYRDLQDNVPLNDFFVDLEE